jgi:hypothetical protein
MEALLQFFSAFSSRCRRIIDLCIRPLSLDERLQFPIDRRLVPPHPPSECDHCAKKKRDFCCSQKSKSCLIVFGVQYKDLLV